MPFLTKLHNKYFQKKNYAFIVCVNLLTFFVYSSSYSIVSQALPINYHHETFVMTEKDGRAFPSETEAFAEQHFAHLCQAHLFQARIVENSLEVRNYVKASRSDRNKAYEIKVRTKDGVVVPCLYFNRNSDKLVVIGSGFTNPKEVMTPFAVLFDSYDLVFFDFRGQGYHPVNPLDFTTWTLDPSKLFFGIDASKVSFGQKEHQEVSTVVRHLKEQRAEISGKPYSAVYGVGICYSALIFLKAMAAYPETKLFDKVILDGCWFSLFEFIEKLKGDPALLLSPQKGGVRDHWFFKKEWVKEALAWVAYNVFRLPIGKDVSLKDDLVKLPQIPYLFFYGKNDLVVDRSTFERLWNGIKSPQKAAVITSDPHVRNHRYHAERYKIFSELFFELDSVDDWLETVTNKTLLQEHYAQKVKNL